MVQVIENSTGQVRRTSKIIHPNIVIVNIYPEICLSMKFLSAFERGLVWPSTVSGYLFAFSLLSLPHSSDSPACLRTLTGFPIPCGIGEQI